MISREIIIVLVLTFIASGMAIPERLFCCSPEMGAFKFVSPTDSSCWDEKSNRTSSLSLLCPSFNVLPEESLNLTITDSGEVLYDDSQSSRVEKFKRGKICFATYTAPEYDESIKLAVLCTDEKEDQSYCMLVSAVFLLLTTVVYAVLPEVRDLLGKSIINFCGSMGIGLAILSASKLTSYSDMTLCAIRGFLTYFFLMVSFYWTNAISLQILLELSRPVVNNYSWKEFCWYALYAWGCPTVLTLCVAIVNFHPGNHQKPGIGLQTCWFYNKTQQWYYMYSVMAVLIIINICIFVYTSVHLRRLSVSSSHVKALQYKYVMTLRMLTIMGITWIFEMISSLTEKGVIWNITNTFNAVQGPLIFLLLVVFRKRVVKALLKRGCLTCIARPLEKYLTVKEDDEVIDHTIGVTKFERSGIERNETETNEI